MKVLLLLILGLALIAFLIWWPPAVQKQQTLTGTGLPHNLPATTTQKLEQIPTSSPPPGFTGPSAPPHIIGPSGPPPNY